MALSSRRDAVRLVMVSLGMTDFTYTVSCCIAVCKAISSGIGREDYSTASDRALDELQVDLCAYRVVTFYTIRIQ